MAYIKNNWVDREGTTRYFETVDNDGALIFTPDYAQVTEMGTPVNADNMNHIEEGIEAGSFTKFDLNTTYAKDDLVTAIVDNELKVYKSLQDNNNGNVLTDSSFWEEVEFAGGGGGTYAMFDPVMKDHVLTYEESKGLELQGTYVYKNAVAGSRYGYPDFYAKCLEEKSQATASTYTLDGLTATIYTHANGHQYYDIADKTAIDTWYNTYGIAWNYGVDTANERIFLPRNDYFFQLTGDTSKVNDYVSAGLPNITGTVGVFDITDNKFTGAFAKQGATAGNHGIAANNGRSSGTATFDASRSSSTYGNSTTVQPPSSKKLLYICVGNTQSDTSWIDVVTQVEEGTKDINDAVVDGLARLNVVDALKTTQITNCITEIPQRIKLELNNGTLTLKAGSKVIVPNGSGVFNELEITSDITCTSTADRNCFYFINSNKTIERFPISMCYSGATAPTGSQYMMWYDTTNNVVKKTSNTGATWTTGISLPFGVFTETTTGITSIDQVFNGFGYIGSTVWVDKGVKGLIPNGRNEDGTLKNVEVVTSQIKTYTYPSTWTADSYLTLNSSGAFNQFRADWVHESEEPPTSSTSMFWFRPSANKLYYTTNSGSTWAEHKTIFPVRVTNTKGVLSNFQPKQPFRAVDYNDYINTPHITEPYVSGTSWYRVYSDGWCEQGGFISSVTANSLNSATITFLKPFKNTNYFVSLEEVKNNNTSNETATGGHAVYTKNTNSMVIATFSWTNGRLWEAKGYIA